MGLVTAAVCAAVAPAATAAEPICVLKPGICLPDLSPSDPCSKPPSNTLANFQCHMSGTFTDVLEEGDLQCDREKSFADRAACLAEQ